MSGVGPGYGCNGHWLLLEWALAMAGVGPVFGWNGPWLLLEWPLEEINLSLSLW